MKKRECTRSQSSASDWSFWKRSRNIAEIIVHGCGEKTNWKNTPLIVYAEEYTGIGQILSMRKQ